MKHFVSHIIRQDIFLSVLAMVVSSGPKNYPASSMVSPNILLLKGWIWPYWSQCLRSVPGFLSMLFAHMGSSIGE